MVLVQDSQEGLHRIEGGLSLPRRASLRWLRPGYRQCSRGGGVCFAGMKLVAKMSVRFFLRPTQKKKKNVLLP